jgi:hypothetical protein
VTSSSSELCAADGEDEDCDGETDEGFEQDTIAGAACPTPVDIGTTSGDTGALNTLLFTTEDYQEAIYVFELTEDLQSNLYLSARIQLVSPPGADYDLYVYCTACDALAEASATTSAALDQVDIVIDDSNGDDTKNLVIVVDWYETGSTQCGTWDLTVLGNVISAAAPICPP